MAKQGTAGKRNFLRINKDGVFYLPVSEREMGQDNVVEVTLDDGKKVYHELFYGGSEDGYINYFDIVERNFPTGKVKQLVISIKGQNEVDSISLNLFDAKGKLSDYVKSVACWMSNVDFNKRYSIKPSTKKNPKGYTYKTLFMIDTDSGELVEREYKMGKDGNVPNFTIKEGIDGSKQYDFEDQDKFLFGKLQEQLERYRVHKETYFESVAAPVAQDDPNPPVQQTTTPANAEEDSDLPF